MRIFGNVYSSSIRSLTRKGRFLGTSFLGILHSYSVPIPRTEGLPITYSTAAAAYMPPPTCSNIVNLLSTNKRDYLIRNNGQKVKIVSLKGKFVAIFFLAYSECLNFVSPFPGLLEAYKILHPKGDFEVVVVALNNKINDEDDSYEWCFNKHFQNMPWLAVPYSDFGTRKSVCYALSHLTCGWRNECFVLDKSGNVVIMDGYKWFNVHGGNWYPFTSQRISEVNRELEISLLKPSLKNLLSSPSRDYVLTKNRDKVLIDDLESKVVGLYFYGGEYDSYRDPVRPVYDKLKAEGMDFEIVYINRDSQFDGEESFNKSFKEMPWLSLPFGDTTCEKLANMLGIYFGNLCGSLVIKKPGAYCDMHGLNVIKDYGIEAYPFTLEKAAEIEVERLSLFSLFAAEDQEFVIQNDNNKTKIMVSNLKKERCMLLVAANVPSKMLAHMINWYYKMKEVYAGFEMIYVSRCESAIEFDDLFKQVPSAWLALPFGTGDTICNILNYSGEGIDSVMIAAFEPDGKYLTHHSIGHEYEELFSNNYYYSYTNYPYNRNIDAVREMCCQLEGPHHWGWD